LPAFLVDSLPSCCTRLLHLFGAEVRCVSRAQLRSTGSRVYYLQAATASQRQEWVSVIRAQAEQMILAGGMVSLPLRRIRSALAASPCGCSLGFRALKVVRVEHCRFEGGLAARRFFRHSRTMPRLLGYASSSSLSWDMKGSLSVACGVASHGVASHGVAWRHMAWLDVSCRVLTCPFRMIRLAARGNDDVMRYCASFLLLWCFWSALSPSALRMHFRALLVSLVAVLRVTRRGHWLLLFAGHSGHESAVCRLQCPCTGLGQRQPRRCGAWHCRSSLIVCETDLRVHRRRALTDMYRLLWRTPLPRRSHLQGAISHVGSTGADVAIHPGPARKREGASCLLVSPRYRTAHVTVRHDACDSKRCVFSGVGERGVGAAGYRGLDEARTQRCPR
jgi:hypothetical protein